MNPQHFDSNLADVQINPHSNPGSLLVQSDAVRGGLRSKHSLVYRYIDVDD